MEVLKYHCPLHDDLVIEILLKLPVKSLLRFKLVCHHWHKILASANFARNHFRQSNSTSLLVYSVNAYFHYPHNCFDVFSLFRVETLERYEDVYARELIDSIVHCIRGPCNGIFCVLYVNNTLALWNPATRRVRRLPQFPFPTISRSQFRFGIDPITDDIKIVVIAPKHVVIYNLIDDLWRVREEESLGRAYLVSDFQGPGLSNGFCYWLRFKSDTHSNAVIVFDMHNELFQEIEMPECIFGSTVNLIWYGDSPAVSVYNKAFDIWIFKEQGCWAKIATFSPPQPMNVCRVAGVWKGNQILVVTSNQKLVICDIDGGNLRTFDLRYTENSRNCPKFAFLFKESLISL